MMYRITRVVLVPIIVPVVVLDDVVVLIISMGTQIIGLIWVHILKCRGVDSHRDAMRGVVTMGGDYVELFSPPLDRCVVGITPLIRELI
jgi:hypothetical protein